MPPSGALTPRRNARPSPSPSSSSTPQKTTIPAPETYGLLPALPPIAQLTTPLARAASHLHTALLPGLLYARFGAVVAEPVDGLAGLLLPLAALQGAFCVLCLPTAADAGTATSGAGVAEDAGEREREKMLERARRRHQHGAAKMRGRIVPALLSLSLASLLTPLLLALLILHGAPLTTHIPHTALLALHISLLATPALFYTHGVHAAPWRALAGLAAPFDAARGAALGALVGAWLGAVPIPLDWDREWQKWPCTVLAGAYLGAAVGKVLGATLGYGRVLDFE